MNHKIFFALFLFSILTAQAALINVSAPANFTIFSTPQNLSVNSSVTSNALQSFTLNWSLANFTIYNSSLVLALDFDDVVALGENQTLVFDNSVYGNNGTWLGDSFNDGTAVGGFGVVSGKFGGGLQFNGSNYVESSNNLTMANFTVCFYFTRYSDSGTYERILSTLNPYGDYGISFQIQNTDVLTFDLNNATGIQDTPQYPPRTKVIALNTQYFVCGTYDGTNQSLYVDNVYIGSKTISSPTTNTGFLELARLRVDGTYYYSFNGSVDGVRVWSRALNATEVAWEVNSSRPYSGFGLVGDWEFEQYKYNNTNVTGPAATATDSQTGLYGWRINMTTNSYVTTVQKYAACTATTAYLMNGARTTYLQNVTFSTNEINFTYPLNAGTGYWILLGSGGSAYTRPNSGASAIPSDRGVLTVTGVNDNTGSYYSGTPAWSNIQSVMPSAAFVLDTHNNVAGKYEGVGNYNGSTYLNVSNSASLNLSNDFSIFAWVKRNSLGTDQYIYDKADATNVDLALNFDINNKLNLRSYNGGFNTTVSTLGVSDTSTWHFIGVTYNQSKMIFYVDSQSQVVSNTFGFATSICPLYIGSDKNSLGGGGVNFFNGSIDGVRVWNRSLTAAEVQVQYQSNLYKYTPTQWNFNTTATQIATIGRYPFSITACDATNCTQDARNLYYGGYTNVSIYDETTTLPLNTTVQIANSSTSTTFTDTTKWLFYDENPEGLRTITATNGTNYAPRTIYSTVTNLTQTNITIYMLASGYGTYFVFNVRTTNGNAIPSANIAISKTINGTNTIIAEQLTDSTGTANFFLSSSTSYNITVQAVGYTTYTATITPSYSPITIIMNTGSSTIITGFWGNVSYSLAPASGVLDYTQQAQKINFTVVDADANLTSVALSIYFNGTRIFYNNTTTASGVSIIATMNNSYYWQLGGTYPQVYAFGQIDKKGYASVNVSASWIIANTTYSPYSLQGSLDYTASQPGLYFIVFIIGIVAMIIIGGALGGGSAATILIMVAVMAVLNFAGFFRNAIGIDWLAFTLFAAIGVLLALRLYL